MYIKLTNGTPENYSIGQLRHDNPQTSFPKNIPDNVLAEWGVYPLLKTEKPVDDYTKNVAEGTPAQQEGQWVQVWTVTDATAEEVAERTASQATEIRTQRTQLLSKCDWTQLSDAPVDKAAWAAYRQSLRDITDQSGFPWNVNWPTQP
jgi:hypothetical protein